MTLLLGWLLVWVVLFKQVWDPGVAAEPIPDPTWVVQTVDALFPPSSHGDLLKGLGFEVMGNYDATHLAPTKEFFARLEKTAPELAEQFPVKGKEVLAIKAEIYKKLIDFFADNQLEEARDPYIYPAYAGLPPPYPY